ncbi:DUF1232 domain-containing protein [Virgibacillus sp. NKC19-16]|uniref:YkvA family protein n=1 Tax=Virgibacillus salidurans TaxID=2831673 RepID=UPI001F2F35AF|nr:DUF1232 domain-containing protein [Virgibacillus sp. NKC19-16]UJL47006.1 DUF1232 domain-containing protein [Virgibacillus sp. NKC19-16]
MYRFFNRIRFLFKFHKSIPFMKDFFMTNEVKRSTKILFAVLIIGYIALPFDLIPDFILLFGIVDDATIAIFLLQQMVKVAPESLKEKHKLFQ